MDKMRIGDVLVMRPNGTSMVWEWTRKLKVYEGQDFDPLRAVNVYGCEAKPCEVTIEGDSND